MIGQTISHYRILEKLGEGGMGIVYRAHDAKLDRDVALKFLPLNLSASQEDMKRFELEAKAISALNHPNIATIYDIDESNGQKYLVLEYIPGGTLKAKLSKLKSEGKEFSISEVIEYGIQMAEALTHAHRHQIIHRDIKTDNMMLTEDGKIKLTDFGLAKLRGSVQLTKTGSTIGTAAYMSPEQVRGEEISQCSDIFSLGVVLYELLTLNLPFKGEFEAALSYSILNDNPTPINSIRKAIPPVLEKIIDRCLQKDRTKRYQNANEIVNALHKVQLEILPTEKAQKKSNKHALIAGGAIILVAVIVLAYFLIPREEKRESRLKMIAVLPFENLGPAEDEYFADGLTDEITSRLSLISKLGVISRTSAVQYKKTSKSLPVIAEELGVDYILEGTIRWVKTGETQRIRITPQLIKVSGDMHLWADNIDRTLDDVFAIQTEIAMRVVKSLDIVLGENEKSSIEAIPTKNLEAYQLYLQGLSLDSKKDRQNAEMAIDILQRAVRLDSTFALAYAQLSKAHLAYFWYGYERIKNRIMVAKEYIDKAFALQSELPEAYIALGYYYYWGFRDYDQALKAFTIAEKKIPNNGEVIASIAYVWRRQGKYEQAAEQLKKAFELSPQDAGLALEVGNTLWGVGRYQEGESFIDRSISLMPDQGTAYMWKSNMYLRWNGDTRKCRNELERMPSQYQPWVLLTQLDIYERNYRAALDRVADAPDSVSVEQLWIMPVTQMRGMVYWLLNDSVSSRASFDSARIFLESEIKKRPEDFRLHGSLGIVYAGLGQADAAVREAELAASQLPIILDASFGVYPLMVLAQVYTMVGRYDSALDKLELLISLRSPKMVTPSILRLDPVYDPLRNNPRFQALVKKGE